MKAGLKNYICNFLSRQKDSLTLFLKSRIFLQNSLPEYLLKKYFGQFVILFCLLIFSFGAQLIPFLFKEPEKQHSVDHLVPKDFVLMPIAISNAQDIRSLMAGYGVVDLYAYSETTGLPDRQVASVLKVIPPQTEEGQFVALVPEKEAIHLFEYSEALYAVIQNPGKTGSKIYRKKKNKSLIVIEESF